METTVLIVDDTPEDRLIASAIVTEGLGYRVVEAENGKAALLVLEQQPIHVVLTDLQMPEMNGLKLVDAVRTKFPLVPLVLMTAYGSEEIAIQALQRGASSYVPKKKLDSELVEVLERVVNLAKMEYSQLKLLEKLDEAEFQFTLDSDPAPIPALVRYLQEFHARLELCKQAGKIRIGVALEEALLNAHFHGNLEVSSELRQNGDAPFHALAAERRLQSPYRERKVRLCARFTLTEATYCITDEGPGFDVSALPDPTDPENLSKCSGRGILLIRTFMDEANYNDRGNSLTLIKRRP